MFLPRSSRGDVDHAMSAVVDAMVFAAPFTVAINPLVGNAGSAQLLLASATGRIYETANAGAQWFLIEDPATSGMDPK